MSALIELGAGFHPEISGRENVFINGIMLGLSKREVQRRFDEIVEFAELRGLHRRAGEDLLVGHVHAARVRRRDQRRSRTCCSSTRCSRSATRRSRTSASTSSPSSAAAGKTILLVTHSLGLVERFCDEALWLDAGQTRARGRPEARRRRLHDRRRASRGEAARPRATRARQAGGAAGAAGAGGAADVGGGGRAPADRRRRPRGAARHVPGDRGALGHRARVEITGVALLGGRGEAAHVFRAGEPVTVRLAASARTSRSTTSSSASASSTPKASAATARTPTSRSMKPESARGRRRR